jgi:hypothetical protein
LYDFVQKLGKDEEERLCQMAKNHATVKTNFNNEIESNNLNSNFDKNEERETLL